jgi:hypothetical protein
MKKLRLSPIGFVSLNQAIIYRLKQTEGVPPTVILISFNSSYLTIFLYKVGKLVGYETIPNDGLVLSGIENTLKKFPGVEVLPSKILLFGADSARLGRFKEELIAYPWTAKLKFIHFPKIEIMPPDFTVASVSMAGAGELTNAFSGSTDGSDSDTANPDSDEPESEAGTDISGTGLRDGDDTNIEKTGKSDHDDMNAADVLSGDFRGDEEPHQDVTLSSPTDFSLEDESTDTDENNNAENLRTDKEKITDNDTDGPDHNVKIVSPEEFGFKPDTDVLEFKRPENRRQKVEAVIPETGMQTGKTAERVKKPDTAIIGRIYRIVTSRFSLAAGGLASIKPVAGRWPVIAGIAVLICAVVIWLVLTVLPRATVEISVQPNIINETIALTIDPTIDTLNTGKSLIPGRKLEKTLVGEKTVTVTGKKKVGDPAKGTVTIYNKVLTTKTFRKGTVLTSGSLKFTLDNDVQIASASESIGSITYGKGTGSITAVEIGSQGNLPTGTEFRFTDTSESIAVARNEEPLAGGTSRDISVVSRADYDALVKAVTGELVANAKDQLSSGSSTIKLVESTVKTSVSEKKFSHEIEEETNQLKGTVSVVVSGIGYDENDIRKLAESIIISKIPAGYEIVPGETSVSVSKIQIKKDGMITGSAEVAAVAFPKLDAATIAGTIAGKTILEAEEILKQTPGINEVGISFDKALITNRLPKSGNITVRIITNK